MTSASAGVVDASPAERSCRNNRSGKMLLRANCEKSVARAHRANVGLGSWLCENTLARDRDSINVSQRTVVGARSVASRSYFGALRKILLAACQIFAFLHMG